MNFEELKAEKQKVRTIAQKTINKLNSDYALEHSPFKVDDIITCGNITIKIKSFLAYMPCSGNKPMCYYLGNRLKKNLLPFKNHEKCYIYQSHHNDIKKIN